MLFFSVLDGFIDRYQDQHLEGLYLVLGPHFGGKVSIWYPYL